MQSYISDLLKLANDYRKEMYQALHAETDEIV